ncbi:MAG: hypothetical protein ABIP03_06005 [Aquihabitans sp.]
MTGHETSRFSADDFAVAADLFGSEFTSSEKDALWRTAAEFGQAARMPLADAMSLLLRLVKEMRT